MTLLGQLIEAGANTEAEDSILYTPLHIAASHNSYKVTELLIASGANVNALDKDSRTPLFNIKVSDSHINRNDAFKTAELLIKHGADVSVLDREGNSILYYTSETDFTELSELLIQKGVDVNHRNNDKCSALYIATLKAHVDTVELLICKHAEIDIQDSYGETPLMTVATYHNEIEYLDGERNFHYDKKKYKKLLQITKLLLLGGANPEHKSNDGESIFSQRSFDNSPIMTLVTQARVHKFFADLDKANAAEEDCREGAVANQDIIEGLYSQIKELKEKVERADVKHTALMVTLKGEIKSSRRFGWAVLSIIAIAIWYF